MQFKLLNATKYNEKSLKGMKTTNGTSIKFWEFEQNIYFN